MTDNRTTEYLKKMGGLKLSAGLKARMREELDSYADFHAVRVAEDGRSIKQVQSHSVFTLFTNSQLRIMKATLLIALLVGAGGTSFAAQGAVPGDLLYPVKVHVNENVRSALTVGADAEAQLQADILSERLQEAQTLAARGKLEGEVAATVSTSIAAQVKKAVEVSGEAHTDTAASVRADITQALATFSENINAMDSSSVQTDIAADVASKISTQIDALMGSESNTSLNMEIAGGADVETIIANAQARIANITAALTASADLSAQAQADFRADIQHAVDLIAKAQASLQANAEAQAKVQANNALEVIGTIEAALNSARQIKIDSVTGAAVDLELDSTAAAGAGTSGNTGSGNVESGTTVEGSSDMSVQDDIIGTQVDTDTSNSVTGSLGL